MARSLSFNLIAHLKCIRSALLCRHQEAASRQYKACVFPRHCISRTLSASSHPTSAVHQNGAVDVLHNGEKLSFLNIWLRDHCRCSECLQPMTKQKQIDTFQIPLDIKPEKVWIEANDLLLEWPDKHVSRFSIEWLQQHKYGRFSSVFDIDNTSKVYWGKEIKEKLPEDIDFDKALHSEQGLRALYQRILEYGFAFVKNTPLQNEAFEALLDKVGRIKKTHYGDRWEFTGGNVDYLDTAYLTISLGGHTDGTYFSDSPGLQIFHCKYHDGQGGENLLVDGIHAALQLRKECPDAFDFFSTTPLPAVSHEDQYIFRNSAPIIRVDPSTQQIFQVRINNYDRDVLTTLDPEQLKKFYFYLKKFYSILRSPANSYFVKLVPGRPVIVDNWRVLHGRTAFTGTRTMYGCYIQKDDFLSRARFLLGKT